MSTGYKSDDENFSATVYCGPDDGGDRRRVILYAWQRALRSEPLTLADVHELRDMLSQILADTKKEDEARHATQGRDRFSDVDE
jgi:hypothetical protein